MVLCELKFIWRFPINWLEPKYWSCKFFPLKIGYVGFKKKIFPLHRFQKYKSKFLRKFLRIWSEFYLDPVKVSGSNEKVWIRIFNTVWNNFFLKCILSKRQKELLKKLFQTVLNILIQTFSSDPETFTGSG
jgi:hypothetical protein